MKTLLALALLAVGFPVAQGAVIQTNSGWAISFSVQTNIVEVGQTLYCHFSFSAPPWQQLPERWDPGRVAVGTQTPTTALRWWYGGTWPSVLTSTPTNAMYGNFAVYVVDWNFTIDPVAFATEYVVAVEPGAIISQPMLAAAPEAGGLRL